MSVLAVTGATGNVGGRVARLLAAAGVPQRLVVRDAGRAPSLPGATVVTSTYGDGAAARRAPDGVDTLFMASGAEAADRADQHRTFIDAGAAAGGARIVDRSFCGPAAEPQITAARHPWRSE